LSGPVPLCLKPRLQPSAAPAHSRPTLFGGLFSGRSRAGCAVVPFALLAMLSSQSAWAASAAWTGTTSNLWSTTTNWNPSSSVPGSSDTATFNGAGNGNTTIDLGAGASVQGLTFDTSSAAAYTIGAGAVGSQTLSLMWNGSITVNSTVTANQQFNALLSLGIGAVGNRAYSITNNSATALLTFAGGITIDPLNTTGRDTLTVGGAGNTAFSGIVSNGTGTSKLSLSKGGVGTLTLTGANTYTGSTTLGGGTLLLDFSDADAPASNIISSGDSLVMAGGLLSIKGKGSGRNTQTLVMTQTANTGLNSILVNDNGSSGVTTLALSSTGLGARGAADTMNIDLSQGLGGNAAGDVITTTAAAATLGWATVKDASGAGFARYNGANVVRLTGQTALAVGSNNSSTDFLFTGAGATLSHNAGNWAANSLTLDTTANTATLDIGGGIMSLTQLGLLMTGGNNATIQNGQIGAAASEVIVQTMGAGTLTLAANTSVSSGAGSLTKSGAGTLILAAAQTFTGATNVNQGTLQLNNANSLQNSTVTLGGGVTNGLGFGPGIGTFNLVGLAGSGNAILQDTGSSAVTLSLGGASATSTYSGILSGPGGIAKVGTGTLNLNGANTFTGGLTIKAGTVSVSSATGSFGDSSSTITLGDSTGSASATLTFSSASSQVFANPITVAAGTSGTLSITGYSASTSYSGPIALNNDLFVGTTRAGGAIGFSGLVTEDNNPHTITENLSGATFGGDMAIGSGGLTLAATVGTLYVSGNITGNGPLTVKSIGGAVTISGANTFTGGLYIKAGTVSLNSAAAAGDVANTIFLGDSSGSTNVTLQVPTGLNANPISVVAGNTGTATIYFNTGAGAITGPITLNSHDLYVNDSWNDSSITGGVSGTGNLFIANNAGGTLTLSGGAINNTGNITFNTNGSGGGINVSANITNTGTITNNGTSASGVTLSGIIGPSVTGVIQNSANSTLVLSGANSYTGPTTITAGTLWLSSSLSPSSVITIGSSGTLVVSNYGTLTQGTDFASVISGSGSVNKAGTGTLILNGANTYSGMTKITSGTLSVASLNKVSGGSASSSLGAPTTAANGMLILGSGGNTGTLLYTGVGETTDRTIQVGNNSATPAAGDTGGATIQNDGSGALVLTAANFNTAQTGVIATTARVLTLQGSNGGGNMISGIIQNNTVGGSGTGNVALTKAGAGTWILSGANTYTGPTTVTGGLLKINGSTAAGSAVGVSGGALGGTGTINGAVTLSGTGGINLMDGAVGTLKLGSTLTVSGSAGANNLFFDLGAGAAGTDKITVGGATTVSTAGAAVINLYQFGGVATRITPGTYTLIQGTGSMAAVGQFAMATSKAFGETFSLGVSGANLQVTAATGTPGPTAAWWRGGANPWSTAANWNTTVAGGVAAGAAPGYQTNVNFYTTTPVAATLTSNTIDVDFDINSLNFASTATSNVTIGGTGMLTIEATNANGNTVGNGITLANTAGTDTISAKVGLAASQTWTVGTGATLVVSGAITDFGGGCTLTKAGGGTLTLSGTNTFTGGLTIKSGTVNLNNAAFAATGAITLGDTAATSNPAALSLGASTTYANPVTVAAGTSGTLTLSSGNFTGTFSGPVSLNNSLTTNFTSGSGWTFSGLVTQDSTAHTITNTNGALAFSGGIVVGSGGLTLSNNSVGYALTVSGGVTGTGNLTLQNNSTAIDGIVISGANINNTGAIINSGSGYAGFGNSAVLISSWIGGNVTGVTQASNTSLFNVASTITLSSSNMTFTSSGAASFNLSGAVTGSGNLVYAANSTGAITLGITGSLNNAGTITNSGSGGGAVNINGNIGTGVTGVTQNSASSPLILSGSNSYTGPTTINVGTLWLGANYNTGSLSPSSAITVNSNGTLGFNRIDTPTQGIDFANVISGSGGVTQAGSGSTLVLNGANIYTGATTVNAGTLQVGDGTSGSLSSSSALVLGGGTFTLLGMTSGATSQTVNGLTLNAGASAVTVNANGGSGTVLNLGAITRAAGGGSADFTLPTGTQSAANGITTSTANTNGIIGTGWATVGGGDFATNSGGNLIAYTGYTAINATGSTIANGPATNVKMTAAGGGGNVTLGASTTAINTLLQGYTTASTLATAGKTLQTNGIAIGLGNADLTLGATPNDGTLQTATAGGELVLNNLSASALTVNAIIANNTSASSLTKLGSGSLTLGGANTYTGATSITAGILNYQNATAFGANSAITVSNGATAQLQGGFASGGTKTLTISGAGPSGASGALENVSGINSAAVPVVLASDSTIASDAGALTLSGGVTGAHNLTLASQISGAITLSGAVNNGGTISNYGAGGGTVTLSGGIGSNVTSVLQNSATSQLTLSGTNTYTGPTTVGVGSLSIARQSSLYNSAQTSWIPANISVFPGATLALGVGNSPTYFDSTAVTTFLNSTHMGASTPTLGFQSGASLGFDTTNATAGTFTYSSAIINIGTSNNNGLTKLGTGALVLSGANRYTGGTTVSAGDLVAGVSNATTYSGAFGPSPCAVTLGDAGTTGNGASPSVLIGGAFTVSNPINVSYNPTIGTYSIGGSTDSNATFSGPITLYNALTVKQVANAGSNTLSITGGITAGDFYGNQTLTFAGPGNISVNTTAIADYNGNTISVNVTGGTTTLADVHTYSGTTTVSGGKLVVSGSLSATASVLVANGAQLNVNGLINTAAAVMVHGVLSGGGSVGAVTVASDGKLSPGNSPGSLSVDSLTLQGGGSYKLELASDGSTGTAGTKWDQVKVTNALVLTDSSLSSATPYVLSLTTLTGSNVGGPLDVFNASTNHTWASVFTFGSITGTFNKNLFQIDTTGFQNATPGGTFSVALNGNSIDLQYLAVPEPATWAMLVGGLGMIAFGQRLRRRFNT